VRLNNRESTRKYSSSGTFIDLCDRCFSYVAEEIPDITESTEGFGADEEDYNAEDMEGISFDPRGADNGSE
jgi:hypothetical protein